MMRSHRKNEFEYSTSVTGAREASTAKKEKKKEVWERKIGPVTDAAAEDQEGEKGGVKKIPFHSDPLTSSRWLSPLAAACLQTLICLLTVDPTLPLLFTPEDQCNIFSINFILHALKLLLAHAEIMLNSSGAESPLAELFGDSLFLTIIMLSYENITEQQTLSFSKGHKKAGPLGKESFTLVDSELLLLKENDQKVEPARVLSPTARTSPNANPPLRLFNPRQSLRMSIIRQPTPVTPQKFTAGRNTPPLDDSLPDQISGDMRLADDSDSEPPPPPSEPPSPGPPTPEPTPPPENEEWESDVLLPSPPQTMPTLTQRRQRMLLVSVQIITHSLSLLIPPVCDDGIPNQKGETAIGGRSVGHARPPSLNAAGVVWRV
ncbi:hypothetical protein BLNAU_20509 [Blattamonas nauphoetae]|uniref:Uncharacterized protein n=1 Tax=Blattamonas nauphoetae TaxID=2049346 RepID=A0ABQ9WYF6_9EUKA|nr:hypothetical protein BLNAU_20509 [Blattamonas nauphoetae]